MDTEILKEIGLTDGEIRVYLALFSLGSTSTGPLIKESKVHASKVYPILDRLIEKGLVSFIKEGKKTIYSANSAITIFSYLDKLQNKLKDQRKSAEKLVYDLEKLKLLEKTNIEATLFKGIKGLKTAYTIAIKDLKKDDEVYEMFLPTVTNKSLSPFLINLVTSLSKKNKVIQYMLFNQDCFESEKAKKLPRVKVKIGVPQEYKSPAEVCVYGDNTIIATTGGKEYITILIKNKEIANSFKNQFSAIWSQDVIVSHGVKALIHAHEKTYQRLSKGEEYVYLGIPNYQPAEHHEYWKKDHEKRIKAGIKCRLLFNKDADKEILKDRNTYGGCDARYMETDIKTPSYMNIFKDTVVISIPKKNPIVIEIKNKEVASSFKGYFESFWKQSKKLK